MKAAADMLLGNDNSEVKSNIKSYIDDKREFIVWGTGRSGRRFLEKYNNLNIAYVVDSDIRKKGKDCVGHLIYTPDDIKDWSKYQVIIASVFYDEIKDCLEKLGLVEHKDFWKYKNVVNFFTMQELLNQIDTFLGNISNIGKEKKNRLFLGRLDQNFKENIACYINNIAKHDKAHKWFLLSESPLGEEKDWLDSIEILTLPCLFLGEQQKENLSDEELNLGCVIDEELHDAALVFQHSGMNMAIDYAYTVCRKAYDFYCKVLEILEPDRVYTWNEFSALHRVFVKACRKMGTEVCYVENGLLPGTLMFDRLGQMGESAPAIFYEEFQQISVKQEEEEHARQVITFLRESGMNRYQQKQETELMDSIRKRLLPDRPVILYAGQLDYMAGMVPYNKCAIRYHSPVFETSEEAAVFFKKLAKENNWNLIFKAHPWLYSHLQSDEKGFQCINGGNINDIIDICDLVITITSTVSYIALIRNKPVLMLGYTQLRYKGCTYEAFEKDKIHQTVEEALEKGMQPEMKESFVKHVARLEKAYLYDDMTEKAVYIGKSFDQMVKEREIL